jgi:hypothetical protein
VVYKRLTSRAKRYKEAFKVFTKTIIWTPSDLPGKSTASLLRLLKVEKNRKGNHQYKGNDPIDEQKISGAMGEAPLFRFLGIQSDPESEDQGNENQNEDRDDKRGNWHDNVSSFPPGLPRS